MPIPAIIRHGGCYVTYSFTTGTIVCRNKTWVIRNDTDALAYALYLERRGRDCEAQVFLEQYLQEQKT